MSKNTHNSGLLGTGTHTEKHYSQANNRNNSTPKRRNKRNCVFYDKGSNFCNKLKITCVGFSNEMCPKHDEKSTVKLKKSAQNVPHNKVWHPSHGEGIILAKQGKGYNIKWTNCNRTCFYSNLEVKEMKERYDRRNKK
ncbi:MAG: hypothetical protein ACI32P_03210 [Catenibacterium mitsuokai]